MMRVWRTCDARYCEGALSGEGAFRFPGRWNMRGVPMVYTATSATLAILELLVNTDRENAPENIMLVELQIPGRVPEIDDADLPVDWNTLPAPESTRLYGTSWARSRSSLFLAVPSVVLPTRSEQTILLNPLHRNVVHVVRINVTPYSFDHRLLARRELINGR